MEVILLTISKQASDIINSSILSLTTNSPILPIRELLDKIYDLYPKVSSEEYNLYWRYSENIFYKIYDYLSYVTVLTLMVDRTIYMVLQDCDQPCKENEFFLRKLDAKELAEKLERERDIYDVKIVQKSGEIQEEEKSENTEISLEPRTDTQIITYAIRKFPEEKYFTSDLTYKSNLIRTLRKGWTKLKNKLTSVDEEVIERTTEKKTSKKDFKGKKDSKSDKTSKKSKKGKM